MDSNYQRVQENVQMVVKKAAHRIKSTPEEIFDAASNLVINKLVDELLLEVIAGVHKETVRISEKDTNSNPSNSNYFPVEKCLECLICPNCLKPVDLSTMSFADHLRICLFNYRASRTSSRIASSKAKEPSYKSSSTASDDETLQLDQKKKRDKFKKSKHS